MAVTTTANLTNTIDSISNVSKALKQAMPLLVYPMFGQSDDLPKRQGSTLKWYRPVAASEVTGASGNETPSWAPDTHSVDTITANLDNFYGKGREITENLNDMSVFDLRPDILRYVAEEAGRSIKGNVS